ncbi:MAG: hypothetical protein SFU53_07515 [Terrimicrobiaceae bacterium]|nr:hypothetical protein [Terrimicrobiaceae bacterium]
MLELPFKDAENELERHLRLGRDVRSTAGSSRIRDVVTAKLAIPANQRICREFKLTAGELSLAFTELIALESEKKRPGSESGLWRRILDDPNLFRTALQELHRVTHGQAQLHRRAAILNWAKRRAEATPVRQVRRRRTSKPEQFKNSISSFLPGFMIVIALMVAIAVYLFIFV